MKNIILLITDTFRYDNLGGRAERLVRTPELDRFASERAVSLEHFYTGSFPTIPHRTDLATGTLGWLRYDWQPIDQSSPNHIAALLRDAGYATQLICDCPHLFHARFQRSFDAAFQHRGQEGDVHLLHLNDPIEDIVPNEKTRTQPMFRGHTLPNLHRWTNRQPRNEWDTFPAKTGQTVIQWLEENYKAGPFFLWVDFFDPHEPWDAPEYLVRRYDPDYDGTPMLHPNYGFASAYTRKELHNLWAHYAAEAELVDRWLGRVIQKIDDLSLWNDSIVVVTSDHGMSLGEHDRTGKSNISKEDTRYWPLYPEISHVPFLIAGSNIPRGQSLDVIAQPIDLLPTLSDLAGVSLNPKDAFQGRSFADAVLRDARTHREFAVAGAYIPVGKEPSPSGIPAKSTTPFLVTDCWGYAPVGASGEEELYDLKTDPLAQKDIASENRKQVEKLRARFLQYLCDYDAPAPGLALWEHTIQARIT